MNQPHPEQPWYETTVIPALLRHARTAYGTAIRKALAAVDCDDVPKNGMYVIGGLTMGAGGVALGQLVKELGVSRQAAGQLVDTLVLRSYLERAPDPDGRRKDQPRPHRTGSRRGGGPGGGARTRRRRPGEPGRDRLRRADAQGAGRSLRPGPRGGRP